jgi:hypothetical protein
VVGAYRSGLEALVPYPSEHRLRALLLRKLRDVLAEGLQRVGEALEIFDEEIALLGSRGEYFFAWIDAQNSKAAFLREVAEDRHDRRWIDQSLATYRAAIAALEQATAEQKRTSEWLHYSELLPRNVDRAEKARTELLP